MPSFAEILPPRELVRVERIGNNFSPPSWEYARDDGTFGGRYDDPSGREGTPSERRFRVIYCSTSPSGSFAETLGSAPFRPSITLLSKLRDVDDDEASEQGFRELADVLDPADPSRGLLPLSWRLARQLCRAKIMANSPCVDICHPESVALLRERLATLALELGLEDISLSDILGSRRHFTQACSRTIHREGYSGIRYLSRYGEGDWECWALFADRITALPNSPQAILPSDPHLKEVARTFRLTIEGPKGHYSRP